MATEEEKQEALENFVEQCKEKVKPGWVKFDYYPLPAGRISPRDWFAGQALVALLAFDTTVYTKEKDHQQIADRIANRAYFVADAMLEARKK